MKKTQLQLDWFIRVSMALGLLLLARPAARAQEACLLEPVPLARRVAAATLVVEARVAAVRSQDEGAHIVTLNELSVFKVFRGALPAGPVQLATLGGTVGLQREEVSNSPQLTVGEQGIFLLEPDPGQPTRYRLYAGPQGLIRYDLTTATAAEPFAHYASIPDELYRLLEAQTGQAARPVRPNDPLQNRLSRAARPGAAPTVAALSPTTMAAGTGAVLTITGTGFGDTQGSGSVSFRNANNGGQSYVTPLATDYLKWTDTEIQVRVPTATSNNAGPAGSGTVLVTSGAGQSASSPQALTVDYALINVSYQTGPTAPLNAYRAALAGTDKQGGYTLQYNERFAANAPAKAAFERALQTWRNGVGANRKTAAATTTINTDARDWVNVVSFDDAPNKELAAGVLGVTYSYYTGCSGPTGISWVLAETDYIYDEERSWQFTTADPAGGQFDFESVALHEQGHGIQLNHIIKPGAVMHYAIGANTKNRVLNATNDVAGANAEINLSLGAVNCELGAYARLVPATPLPVTLVSFTAAATSGGVQLQWRTATELNSAYFAVEATPDPTTARWAELTRVPAAGTSTSLRAYSYLDTRPLAGMRYYRLRQQDEDGPVHYSEVVPVSVTAGAELLAYPNPFGAELLVQVPAGPAATLRLLDLTGRSVYGLALPAGQTQLRLTPAADLRPGVYLLEWRSGSQVQRTRVVKQ